MAYIYKITNIMIPNADSLSYKLKKFIEKRIKEFSDDQGAYSAYYDTLLEIEKIEGENQ